MRKLILAMQMSLDGFVAGENEDMSFFETQDNSLWAGVFDTLKNTDTCVLGRVMFPGYRDYWKNCLTSNSCSDNERKYAKWADKTTHIVFSKTLTAPEWQNTTINSGSPADEVKKLKNMSGGDIYIVGGAMLARTLLDADLVDEYRLTVAPIIVQKGKSLFSPLTKRHKLSLTNTDQLKSGVLVLKYKAASA